MGGENIGNSENFYDVVIIGGGPAGLTAGLYLARACYKVLIVEKEKFGGQITITSEVVNYPGILSTDGKKLTETMRKQAENFGAEFLLAEVTGIEADGDMKKVITGRGTFECFGILVATGAHPRMIGFAGEAEYRGHGVAYCATCDGEFFTGKEVFVVGGGFAAAEESVFLTKYASHVTVLVRGEDFSCAKATADETKANAHITVCYNTVVEEVKGDSVLRSITYKNTKTGEQTTFVPENGDTFGVFVFAGYQPSTELVKGLVELDDKGYIVTDRQQKTSVDGVYAAGDVCIKNLRQVITAAGDGALAATELEKYCSVLQQKTGRKPQMPVKRAATHKPVDSGTAGADNGETSAAGQVSGSGTGTASGRASGGNGLFSEDMVRQLDTVFARMENPLLLKLFLDDRNVSRELEAYMEELAGLTDKIRLEKTKSEEQAPCVRICDADGTDKGMAFHGVPGGHEFTSFVLGLYNAAGPGQKIEETTRDRIANMEKKIHMAVMVSLTCTMCPELVVAAQRIASLNDKVSVDVYDLNHFPDMRERYNVMSVPCYIVNEGQPMFGKKSIKELLDVM